jgi:[methyl-Co(III) methanol-specific corrinoid protein]:coenzyme M methyltransferase
MMNSAIVEIMEGQDYSLPAAHNDTSLMTRLAAQVQEQTGFENFGLPFCMTIEPQALGSQVDFGSLKCEPKISKEVFNSVTTVNYEPKGTVACSERALTVAESLSSLSKCFPDIPAVGSLTGPLSLAASLVEPMMFLRELRKSRAAAHLLLDYVSDQLIDFAYLMVESGASVISINDPTATGEILGPNLFEEYAVFYLNHITEAIQKTGVPVIIHICGDIRMVVKKISRFKSEAVSFDAMVNLEKFKAENPQFAVMGNLSTFELEFGSPEKIQKTTEYLIRQKVDLKAPACGLSTTTPLANIRTFTEAVKTIQVV